ncbi:MAG: hypothetical protein JW791_03320 [Nanoarchaeota archaeon]|nr:hypothetical protein [Nanoarchaeota archaeon]
MKKWLFLLLLLLVLPLAFSDLNAEEREEYNSLTDYYSDKNVVEIVNMYCGIQAGYITGDDSLITDFLTGQSINLDDVDRYCELAHKSASGLGTRIPEGEAPALHICVSNLGASCQNINDCVYQDCSANYWMTVGCNKCPEGSIMVFQIDSDPYYARLTNNMNYYIKDDANNYCTYDRSLAYSYCINSWNNYTYTSNVFSSDDSFYINFLNNEVLDAWKNEVIKNISSTYFDSHIRVSRIDFRIEDLTHDSWFKPQSEELQNVDSILILEIYGNFTYDWLSLAFHDNFPAAGMINGDWVNLTTNQQSSYYELESLRRYVFLSKERSIISQEELISKAASCNQGTIIQAFNIINNSIYARGYYKVDPEACLSNEYYTSGTAYINLETGETTCELDQETFCTDQEIANIPNGRIIRWINLFFKGILFFFSTALR